MAYQYQQYDSYFVMSDNDHREMVRRESAKEYEVHQKKQIQLRMAERLSRLAKEEYGVDILRHMEEQELKTLPDVASIDIQSEIQWFMRPYLLDFLIEAHASFALNPDTLFLTINLLDRYCSKRIVYRRHYQLVGCTALLIAAKYSEPGKKVPHIRELANMCCHLYDEDMFTQMERHVMITLEWVLGPPTVDAFHQIALDDGDYDPELEHMARYIAEIALFHKDFVSTRPSEMAKATLALSRVILNRQHPQPHEWAAGYEQSTLIALSQVVRHPSQILLQKYKSSHVSRTSLVLKDFLAQQDAVARHQMAPPTPPCEHSSSMMKDNVMAPASFHTPQKCQYPVNMPRGCLTPPITPESDCFGSFNPGLDARKFPGTPTPINLQPQPVYCGSYYQPTAMM
ncbi:hypothetical protein MMC26_005295 [Xylographa opegraphella]|nr:hypothetical protein [Xylographa opegraphella]